MKTRAGATSAVFRENTETNNTMGNPSLKLLVLPQRVSSGARICTLAHPRTLNPSRYYFCPERGVFEFIRIAAPMSTCQSWLIGPQQQDSKDGINATVAKPLGEMRQSDLPATSTRPVAEGYVAKSPELFVATPIDPLFLILPSFCEHLLSNRVSSINSRFISIDDLIERLEVGSKHLDLLSSNKRMREMFDARIIAVCDMVQAGDEKMYRLNMDKLLNELILKAKNMVASGFPASLEEKFVRKALEAPMMALKREDSSFSEIPAPSEDGKLIPRPLSSDHSESQTTILTSDSKMTTSTSSVDLSIPEIQVPWLETVAPLLRLRTALCYMISSYILPSMEGNLNEKLASTSSPIDFKPLDEKLAQIASLRAEALASRSLSDFSRKRSMNEDEELAESRAEKKQRKEEEEKRRKAGESRGVRDLKKVDVSGMKKMSDFFSKGPAKKKKK